MRFQSKYNNYIVWLIPSNYKVDAYGNRTFVQGLKAEFVNGFYKTEDEEIIKKLKENKYYGVDFWSLDEIVKPNKEGVNEKKDMEEKSQQLVNDCPQCGKHFANKAGLMAHIRFVHSQ